MTKDITTRAENPSKSDEKSGKVGRTFPDFEFEGKLKKGKAIHKERLFLHFNWLELVQEHSQM